MNDRHPTLEELTTTAIDAAKAAGEILQKGFGSAFRMQAKPGIQNLVTEYDQASEKSILSFLLTKYPDHNLLAEESGYSQKTSSPYTWIIDPLDGTINFAHQVPLFSVSIAIAKANEILVGVVYQPILNELFVAQRGQGAQLNGKPIHVTKTTDPLKALMATGFPYDVHTNPLHCIDQFAKIQGKGIPIRRLGSAAIDLAYVACGRFDSYWEVSLQPWDMAAGMLLVQEAGGKVTDYSGSSHYSFSTSSLIASNGLLHPFMIEHLK